MFRVRQVLSGPEMASLIIKNRNRQELTALTTIPLGIIKLHPIRSAATVDVLDRAHLSEVDQQITSPDS
jgi:hypothetical protein